MPAGTPSFGASVGNRLLHASHQRLLESTLLLGQAEAPRARAQRPLQWAESGTVQMG